MSDDEYASVMNRAMALCEDDGSCSEQVQEPDIGEERLPPVKLTGSPSNGAKVISVKVTRKKSSPKKKSAQSKSKSTEKKDSNKEEKSASKSNEKQPKKVNKMSKMERLQKRMETIEARKAKVEKLMEEAQSKKSSIASKKKTTKIHSKMSNFAFSGIRRIPPNISPQLERLLRGIIEHKQKTKGKTPVRSSVLRKIRQSVLYDYPIYLGLFTQLLRYQQNVVDGSIQC